MKIYQIKSNFDSIPPQHFPYGDSWMNLIVQMSGHTGDLLWLLFSWEEDVSSLLDLDL